MADSQSTGHHSMVDARHLQKQGTRARHVSRNAFGTEGQRTDTYKGIVRKEDQMNYYEQEDHIAEIERMKADYDALDDRLTKVISDNEDLKARLTRAETELADAMDKMERAVRFMNGGTP
jgi:chromosome segregation ATPase